MKTAKILIVDDYPEILNILHAAISRMNVQVTTAENGRMGLNVALSWKPDLVITDCDMPILDGLRMTREIKSQSPLVPVVMFSGSEFAKDTFVSQCGGAKFFEKSEMTKLVAFVEDFLKKFWE